MNFDDTFDHLKKTDTLGYHRRLNAYLDYVNGGMDDEIAVARTLSLFAELDANPVDHAKLARDESAAKRLEDGE